MKANLLKIILVEDQLESRKAIRSMLSEIGVTQVFEAADGDTAKNLLEVDSDMIDIVICDWNMPNMPGIELLKFLRKTHPHTPFIMITGRNDMNSVVEAKNEGVTAYLRKPFSLNDLETKLRVASNSVYAVS